MPREARAPLRLCWSDPISGEARSAPVDGAFRIGSDWQQNDVVLPLRAVESFHAEVLFTRSGGWEIVATGSRRLKVGGVMTARASLKDGTEFSVGPVAFLVRPVEPSPRRAVRRAGTAPAGTPGRVPAQTTERGPAVLVAILVALTGATMWSELHVREGRPAAATRDILDLPEAGSAPASPRAAGPVSNLEAGSVATSPAEFRADDASSTPTILVKLAGSWVPAPGFYVTSGGLVVTNWRLTASAEGILVRAAGAAAPSAAHVVASDAVRDLALLEAPVTWPVAPARLEDDEVLHAAAHALGVPAADVRAFVATRR